MSRSIDRALKAFYDNLAQGQIDFLSYYLQPVGFSRVAKILRMLAITPEDEVCDIGCGDGFITTQARKKTRRVKALDISHTRVARARVRGIDAICSDAASLPFRNECFDKVICTEVIEHVTNPEAVLEEISRVLRTDGSAVLTVPLNEVLDNTLLDVPNEELASLTYNQIKARYKVKKAHISSFTIESINDLIRGCDLRVDQTDYTYNYAIRKVIGVKFLLKAWQTFMRASGERIMHAPLGTSLIRLVLFLLYKKELTKHHIIARVSKY